MSVKFIVELIVAVIALILVYKSERAFSNMDKRLKDLLGRA